MYFAIPLALVGIQWTQVQSEKWPNGRTLYIPFIQILLRFPHCVVNYNMQRYVVVKLISVSLSVTQLLKRDPRDPVVYRRDDCQWVVSCTVRRVTIGIVSGVASKATVICHRSHWNEMWILWWLLIHQICEVRRYRPQPGPPRRCLWMRVRWDKTFNPESLTSRTRVMGSFTLCDRDSNHHGSVYAQQ